MSSFLFILHNINLKQIHLSLSKISTYINGLEKVKKDCSSYIFLTIQSTANISAAEGHKNAIYIFQSKRVLH